MEKHWNPNLADPKPLVKWKGLLTGQWKGPDVLITCGRGYACIFPLDSDTPVWVPDRLFRQVSTTASSPTQLPERK